MSYMNVGQLRQALDGLSDEMVIVVRCFSEGDKADTLLVCGISSATVEEDHGEDNEQFLAIDCSDEELPEDDTA